MCFDVLHPLSMLVHELVEMVLGGTIAGHTLFQTLERLVGLVELEGESVQAEIEKETDVHGARGSQSA